jgi:hypothetical protein
MSFKGMYKNIDDYGMKLTELERVIKDFEVGGGKLSAEDRRNIKYPAQFLSDVYKLYYRTFDRNSLTYYILSKLISREPDVVYPEHEDWEDKWYDSDVDREFWGYDYTYLGREEYKYTYPLKEPFRFPSSSREYLSDTLKKSSLWICGVLKNFSSNGVMDRGKLGKGVVLYKFYTGDLQYFSIINFTGYHYKNINPDELEVVGERIQPWATELMNFLVEAWIRQDFNTAFHYLKHGVSKELVKSKKTIDKYLLTNASTLEGMVSNWFTLELVFEEIMDVVSYNTILNKPERYNRFVEGVRKGKLDVERLKPVKIKVRA